MDENLNAELDQKCEIPMKWLRMLLYFHIAALVVSVISDLLINDDWSAWVSRALSAGIIVCLLQLAGANRRYRMAAIFQASRLCCSLVTPLVLSPILMHLLMTGSENTGVISVLSTSLVVVVSACAMVAAYFEHFAHGDLAAQADPKLSRSWRSFFLCSMIISVLGTCVSLIALPLFEASILSADAVNGLNRVLTVIVRLMDLIYLWFLYRTIRLFPN